MNRGILSTIQRLGREVDVLKRSEGASDSFNNPTHTWTETRTAQAVRTYPNRNTQQESGGGPFASDNPVFLFEKGQAPDSGQRIRYDNTLYEMQSPTPYDTHVAVFGEIVND